MTIMESYLMMLYVTLEQESALKDFFLKQGWKFSKPDMTVTTDKLGPSVQNAQSENHVSKISINSTPTRKKKLKVKLKAPVVKMAKIVSSKSDGKNTLAGAEVESDVKKLKEFEGVSLHDTDTGGDCSLLIHDADSEEKTEQFNMCFNPENEDDLEEGGIENIEETDTDADCNFEETEEETEADDSGMKAESGDSRKKKHTDTEKASGHRQSKMAQKPYRCEQCGSEYSQKYRLSQHVRQVHMGIVAAHPCTYCDATFNVKSSRNRHESVVHFGLLKHSCEICQKAFANRRLLDGHKRSVHYPETKFKCEICNKAFAFLYNLQAHMKICKRKTCRTCDICSESFNSVETLDAHLLTQHEVERDISCEICDKKFLSKKSLLSHLKFKHENQSDFVCEVCGERYQYPGSLHRHRKRHGHYGDKEPGEL